MKGLFRLGKSNLLKLKALSVISVLCFLGNYLIEATRIGSTCIVRLGLKR